MFSDSDDLLSDEGDEEGGGGRNEHAPLLGFSGDRTDSSYFVEFQVLLGVALLFFSLKHAAFFLGKGVPDPSKWTNPIPDEMSEGS